MNLIALDPCSPIKSGTSFAGMTFEPYHFFSNMLMRNIKLTVAYDGTAYSGWQIQPNGVTIQELLQKAVRSMTGEKNNVVGAGRTDAGVHALAQVAAFRTEKDIPLDGFRRGLNTLLPPDIRVIEVSSAAEDFHPMRDAKKKHYRCLITEGEHEHPLSLNRSWCIRSHLDADAMNRAAAHLLGERDFSAFRAADADDGGSAVRIIYSAEVSEYSPLPLTFEGIAEPPLSLRPRAERGGSNPDNILNLLDRHARPPCFARRSGRVGLRHEPYGSRLRPPRDDKITSKTPSNGRGYLFSIVGSGFLKNMVRNIVGTLAGVGMGKITPDRFKEILESRDRKKAGVCAPASGLYLVRVEY